MPWPALPLLPECDASCLRRSACHHRTHALVGMGLPAQGTFAAAEQKLEYVASLGFTCVQLMPVSEHSDAWCAAGRWRAWARSACMSVHPVSGRGWPPLPGWAGLQACRTWRSRRGYNPRLLMAVHGEP